MVATIFSGQ